MATKNVFEGVKFPLHLNGVPEEEGELFETKCRELAALLVTGANRTEEERKALGDWLLKSPPFSEKMNTNTILQVFMDRDWFALSETSQMVLAPRGIGHFYPERYTELVKG